MARHVIGEEPKVSKIDSLMSLVSNLKIRSIEISGSTQTTVSKFVGGGKLTNPYDTISSDKPVANDPGFLSDLKDALIIIEQNLNLIDDAIQELNK